MQKQPSRVRTRPILARGPRARACNAARKAGEDDILEAGHWIDQEFMEDLVGKEGKSYIARLKYIITLCLMPCYNRRSVSCKTLGR